MRLSCRTVFALVSLFFWSTAHGQLPSVGIDPSSSYQSGEIDSVDLSSGNVNVHIPLIGFPQRGSKLRLNFMVRYNQPLWTVYIDASNPIAQTYDGHWVLGNAQYYALTPSSTLLSPLGVGVVRDQGLSLLQTTQTYPCQGDEGCNGDNDPSGGRTYSTTSIATYIKDRSGATHIVGVDLQEARASAPQVHIAAPDGSGWKQKVADPEQRHP